VTVELARRLLASGAAVVEDVDAALLDAELRGVPFVRALYERDATLIARAERELSRDPGPAIRTVKAVPSLVASLPAGVCERLFVVPVRGDPRTGTVDVATVDVLDQHLADELSHHLRLAVRLVRAPYVEVSAALDELRSGGGFVRGRSQRGEDPDKQTPAFGMTARTRSDPYGRMAPTRDSAIPLVNKASKPAWRQKTDPGVGRGGSNVQRFGEDETGEPILALSRSKVAANQPGLAEPQALDALQAAQSVDEVGELLAEAVGAVAESVIVFGVRPSHYEARVARPLVENLPDLAAVRVPAGTPNLIETALRIGYYLGIVTDTPAHAALREVFGALADREVYALPVWVSERPALVVVAAGFDETTLATRRADALTRAAGAALERIVRGRKRR